MKKEIVISGKCLNFSDKTLIMGILNVTPDSFSDGGRYLSKETAVKQALMLKNEGADILDIGGESSRPGATPVSLEQELERVIPVISEISQKVDIPISIDTCKAAVAKEALNAGASIVNDISGLKADEAMVEVVYSHDVPIVVMHMQGNPGTMQKNIQYGSVIDEIKDFFAERIKSLTTAGIKREKIILDPGIGFGKLFEHNVEIIRMLKAFHSFNLPVLIGTSKKAFIGTFLGSDIDSRSEGTLASIAVSVSNGANIVRVHDVAATKRFLTVFDPMH